MDLGSLRYHGLWCYTGLVALFVSLDKIQLSTVEGTVAILAPIALVIAADVAKYRALLTKSKATG